MEGLGKGDLEPVVAEAFPFDRAADAHRFIEERRNIGKVVLVSLASARRRRYPERVLVPIVASIGSVFDRAIVDTGRQAEFLFFVAFLVTFGFIRTSAHMIRAQVRWWPGNVEVGGTHIHHLVWGILLLMIIGLRRRRDRAALALARDRRGPLRDRDGADARRVRPLWRPCESRRDNRNG